MAIEFVSGVDDMFNESSVLIGGSQAGGPHCHGKLHVSQSLVSNDDGVFVCNASQTEPCACRVQRMSGDRGAYGQQELAITASHCGRAVPTDSPEHTCGQGQSRQNSDTNTEYLS
eukprot:3218986-Amphidinium_carterae.1